MKNETRLGFVLVAILGLYGWILAKKTSALEQQIREVSEIHADSQSPFISQSGLDISGKAISPILPTGTEHTLVFMLHGSSVKNDLNFWHGMKMSLPENSKIKLVAYCDGDTCIDAVRADHLSLDFPVIAYGEIGGAQAVFDADDEASSLLLGREWTAIKRIKWRSPGITPQSIVKEVYDDIAMDR